MDWYFYKLKDGTNAPHTLVSSAGYSLLRCTCNGVPTGRYLLFKGVNTTRDFIVIGGYDSSDAAKAAAEAHACREKDVMTA